MNGPIFWLVVAWLCLVVVDVLVYVKPCSVRLHRWSKWEEYKVVERTNHISVNAWTGARTDAGMSERTQFWQSRACTKCGRSQRAMVA